MSINKGGRPPEYPRLLEGGPDAGWFAVREGHKRLTAPSALRKRYPEFDFKAEKQPDGLFTIMARRR